MGRVEELIRELRDEDSDVRKGAVGALGGLGDLRAVEPLIQAWRDDKDPNIRGRAAEALERLKKS
ncbi:MAG: HEAT repeat domain-containing protein [Candidatus Brocadiales bacterium]|nr:HEAT repeat domain-containing protein [Candidatus Brocadiales bacterium]